MERKNNKAMRNKLREEKKKEEIFKDKVLRVSKAIDEGYVQRRELAKAADVKLHDLGNIFTRERELYAKYCVRRKVITDMAADNIYSVVEDKSHPKNYDASKFIITNFKSEFDEVLESKDGENLAFTLGNNSDSDGGITIRFGSKKEEDSDE